MRWFTLIFVLFCVFAGDSLTRPVSFGNEPQKKEKKNDTSVVCVGDLCHSVVGLVNPATHHNENYIFDATLYQYRVDTLAQIRFWRQIMNLHQDSSLLCFAHNREVIEKVCNKEWNARTDADRQCYRDSVRIMRSMDSTQRILFTTGKRFFYDFHKTYQNFNRGINCFVENGVDPWYAQAILLIESPNKLQKSNAGAYGPFQLMKDVARMFGLKVNRHMDERADFDRSAYAASSLIKKVCIPRVHKMLDSLHITNQNENELWFKLLVMHTYHAGAGNVQNALFTFMPKEGSMEIIYNLWHAQTSRFKSASQNYSQLILAAMLEMNERVEAYEKLAAAEHPSLESISRNVN